MNLYRLISTNEGICGTYTSCIVAAESEDDARHTYPEGDRYWVDDAWRSMDSKGRYSYWGDDWCSPEFVEVELIGITTRAKGVVLASFNAG